MTRYVYVFNTGGTAVNLNVNNTSTPQVVPAADRSTWVPGTLKKENLPVFTGSDFGSRGQFQVGDNNA